MRSSPPADPGTIRISFQIPKDQWAEFEQLTVKQAVAQVLGVKVALPTAVTAIRPSTQSNKVSSTKEPDSTDIWKPYVTLSAHGKLEKGTPCYVNRSSDGRIGVKVQVRNVHKVKLEGRRPTDNLILIYSGELWYLSVYETHGAAKDRRPF